VADMRSPLPAGAADGGPDRRRSHRVQIAMGIIVRGASGATNFSEEVQTISVNAHGCMVRLAAKVARGQQVTIINTKTVEELTCSVTFVGQTDGAKTEVGLEFSEPSPVFWRIAFPPEDWDPSERKRASTTRSAPPAKPVKK
jgi:PilZ domain